MSKSSFAVQVLGEEPTNHPLVVALVIMHYFESFERADDAIQGKFPDGFIAIPEIPGAGTYHYMAMGLLRSIFLGDITPSQAPAIADKRWKNAFPEEFAAYMSKHAGQVDRFLPRFVTKACEWFPRVAKLEKDQEEFVAGKNRQMFLLQNSEAMLRMVVYLHRAREEQKAAGRSSENSHILLSEFDEVPRLVGDALSAGYDIHHI